MKRPISQFFDLLLLLHTALYFLGAVGFFLESVSDVRFTSFDFASHLTFFTVWSVIFLIHERVQHKLQQTRRGMVSAVDERQAYRDGFNDAIQMIRSGDDVPNRLMIDDDGELIEDTRIEKRKVQ